MSSDIFRIVLLWLCFYDMVVIDVKIEMKNLFLKIFVLSCLEVLFYKV